MPAPAPRAAAPYVRVYLFVCLSLSTKSTCFSLLTREEKRRTVGRTIHIIKRLVSLTLVASPRPTSGLVRAPAKHVHTAAQHHGLCEHTRYSRARPLGTLARNAVPHAEAIGIERTAAHARRVEAEALRGWRRRAARYARGAQGAAAVACTQCDPLVDDQTSLSAPCPGELK